MSVILCATRGGEPSIRTQERAIEIAKARGASLLFIFVADVKFLHTTYAAIVVDAQTEIDHMGEFLLLMAKERAENAGVEADFVIEHGAFGAAMKKTAQAHAVDLVVFGRPGEKTNITRREYLDALCREITDDLGIEAIIV